MLPVNRKDTPQDPNAREPIQLIKRDQAVEISAQMEFRESLVDGVAQARFTKTGLLEDETGYALIRTIDFKALNYEPQLGDNIVKVSIGTLGEKDINAYFRRLKPVGHLPEYGSTLLKCFFGDRKPSHNKLGGI